MNKLASLILSILLLFALTAFTQVYTADITSKFASNSDIDFVLISDYNGIATNCQYQVANDTLYEGAARKIALTDINFNPIDIYKNVFNKINGSQPYVLTLKPKPNCFTFYYGTAVNGQIELFLPSEAYALETHKWLYLAANNVKTKTGNSPNALTETYAKDICTNTLVFLNEVASSNLSNYLDEQVYKNDDKTFYSKKHFPGSIKTYIIDTFMFKEDYRSANIIFMEEYPDNATISNDIINKYKELAAILKICLEHNQFKYTNKDANPDALYTYQSEYTKLQEPDPNVLFSSLQTKSGFVVQLVISQVQNENGGYINSLQLNLTAQ